MSELRRYPDYKDSGVPWLGEIPSHWEVWKITHLIERIGSGTTPKTSNYNYYGEEGVLWVTTSELRETIILDTKKKLTEAALEDYSTLKVFPKNSVAIAMYGATIGRLGILGEEATFNQACCVYAESEKINYKFLYYWLWYRRPILISLSNGGGQPNLSQDDLRKLKLSLPPLDEQQAIVNFLDTELEHIDTLIDKQQQLIEKLAEQRSAIITHAVSKGLDADVLMKDSGVEWLGEIPEHWDIKKLKYLLEALRVGPFGSSLKGEDITDEGLWVYNQRSVLDKEFEENKFFISEEKYEELISFKVEIGDILLTTRGTIGRVAIVPSYAKPGIIHPCIIRFRVNEKNILKEYIEIFFNHIELVKEQLKLKSNATTIDVIYSYSLKEIIFPIPPIKEQIEILKWINHETQKIDAISKATKDTIAKLQEYRAALITQAVTGKIDVRHINKKAS